MAHTPRLPDIPLVIDGARRAGSGEMRRNLFPATGEALCSVASASRADCDEAVAAARRAQPMWADVNPMERGRVLLRAANILRDRRRQLAELEVYDTGKPIREAQGDDVVTAIDCLEYMGGLAASIHGHQFPLGRSFAYTRAEPLGVCVGLGAWNYPIQLCAWKLAPCLAAGNAMVFKPSELTPMTATLLAEILHEAGLPAGVFNVVHGAAEVGAYLTSHPDVAKVSVTGSVGTGRKVASLAASTLKKVTLELGGKSPLVIFDDADIDRAVGAALAANFYSQGENCCNGTRVYVQAGIHDRFLAAVAARAGGLIVGDPMSPTTQIGSLISREHRERVLGYIASGLDDGARLFAGGRSCSPAGFEGGSFVMPTVFAGCRDDMRIASEEIFGPVMSILEFGDEEEVIARANRSEYGLAAGVFTKDLARAHRTIARLEAGVCWINTYNYAPASLPFGGFKQSGFGRENGIYAMSHYTQIKSVYVELEQPAFAFD